MIRGGFWTIAILMACIGGAAVGADDPAGDIKPLTSMKFEPDQDVKCLMSAIETGDPKTGRSTLILKAPSGCVVPWHSHTAEEQLIIITGNVISEMLDHTPTRLRPGGFAVMGSRIVVYLCDGLTRYESDRKRSIPTDIRSIPPSKT
jgi:hypothetical protein